MDWFAIRSVYLCRAKSDGMNIFEERVVCFEAGSDDEAHEKAALESARYALANEFEAHPEREGYLQDGDPLIDGYEVWSVMLESRESLDEFYARRYSRYEYRPE